MVTFDKTYDSKSKQCFTLIRVSTKSRKPLQHAVTRACTATWGRTKSEDISSSASIARPWQLASNRASSQAGWDAPALSKISRISWWPSLTATVVAKPLNSFWLTSAPMLCHLIKCQPLVHRKPLTRLHSNTYTICHFKFFNLHIIFTRSRRRKSQKLYQCILLYSLSTKGQGHTKPNTGNKSDVIRNGAWDFQ